MNGVSDQVMSNASLSRASSIAGNIVAKASMLAWRLRYKSEDKKLLYCQFTQHVASKGRKIAQ